MAHGYLREFDEGWDRGDDRERGDRDWNDRNRDRDRGFMFGDRGGDHSSQVDRMGDRARERFSDDDRQWRGSHRDDWSSREPDRRFGGGDWQRSPRNFSSHQDDHYRSWRDRQMRSLDRDYEDYCREREQQFHSDFDSWRRNRDKGQQPARGSTSEEVMELTSPRPDGDFDSGPSPSGEATLGTNNNENTAPGRR